MLMPRPTVRRPAQKPSRWCCAAMVASCVLVLESIAGSKRSRSGRRGHRCVGGAMRVLPGALRQGAKRVSNITAATDKPAIRPIHMPGARPCRAWNASHQPTGMPMTQYANTVISHRHAGVLESAQRAIGGDLDAIGKLEQAGQHASTAPPARAPSDRRCTAARWRAASPASARRTTHCVARVRPMPAEAGITHATLDRRDPPRCRRAP